MASYAYYNGKYDLHERLSVPLSDRALYFGDGVYDVMLVRHGKVYQAEAHFDRLSLNCGALELPFSTSLREVLSVIHRLCDLSNIIDGVAYIQVSRYSERRAHEFDSRSECNLLITVTEYSGHGERSASAITLPDRRYGMCNLKTLNLLPSVIALAEAKRQGADCAIFLRDGTVTEEARSNVAIIKGKVLLTHPLDHTVLPGITRANLLRAARELGIAVEERGYSLEEMISADEILVSSTTKFLRRVTKLNGIGTKCADYGLYGALRERLIMDFLHETD